MSELDDRLRGEFLAVRERVERLSLPDITRRDPRDPKRPRVLAILSAAVVVLLVAGVAVIAELSQNARTPSATPAPFPHVRRATDSRRAVRSAHLVQPLRFDGNALQLDVTRGSPRVTEAQAIALFRAGSPPSTNVENVTVVYADATLLLPVETAGLVIQPRAVPVFRSRPVWAFIYTDSPHGCTALTSSAVALPEPFHVELIAADGSGEGANYQTRGSFCQGTPTGPTATIASYYLSLPWTASTKGAGLVVTTYPAPPACGDIEYRPRVTSRAEVTFGVYAIVLMARPPCSAPPQTRTTDLSVTTGQTLVHEPTGLSVGRSTPPAKALLKYFDGRDRIAGLSH